MEFALASIVILGTNNVPLSLNLKALLTDSCLLAKVLSS